MAFQGTTIYIHQLESQFSHMYEMSKLSYLSYNVDDNDDMAVMKTIIVPLQIN